jgi:hypothetical protein
MSLSDAIDAVQAAGFQYKVNETLDETRTDGTVVEQTPKSGEPPAPLIVLSVARQPVTRYLADTSPVAGESGTGAATVNGKAYAHSVTMDLTRWITDGAAEYDLGRKYRRLKATVGVTDDSSSSTRVTFEVFADGRKIAAETVGLGAAQQIDADLTGVLRLKITATRSDGDGTAVWGDAAILGVPSEVPSETPSASPTN